MRTRKASQKVEWDPCSRYGCAGFICGQTIRGQTTRFVDVDGEGREVECCRCCMLTFLGRITF